MDLNEKRTQEQRMLEFMIQIYCRGNHKQGKTICKEKNADSCWITQQKEPGSVHLCRQNPSAVHVKSIAMHRIDEKRFRML